jgi:hypothetical protein
MKQLLFIFFISLHILSCSKSEAGFIGEWEGETERLNSSGQLIDVEISCNIKVAEGATRSVELIVGGVNYKFDAQDEIDILTFKDIPLNSDSTIISYISGSAEIIQDTILQFDHILYALKNSALLNSEKVILEMIRK